MKVVVLRNQRLGVRLPLGALKDKKKEKNGHWNLLFYSMLIIVIVSE